ARSWRSRASRGRGRRRRRRSGSSTRSCSGCTSSRRLIRMLAENANAYVPLGPGEELVETERFVLWLGRSPDPTGTVAQRFRMQADEVEATVEEIRDLVRNRGRSASTWEVADSATPPDLVERLEQ